jgi:hypothetical protein
MITDKPNPINPPFPIISAEKNFILKVKSRNCNLNDKEKKVCSYFVTHLSNPCSTFPTSFDQKTFYSEIKAKNSNLGVKAKYFPT